MTTITRLTLALAVGAFCLPALAAERRPLPPEKAAAHAAATTRYRLTLFDPRDSTGIGGSSGGHGTGTARAIASPIT